MRARTPAIAWNIVAVVCLALGQSACSSQATPIKADNAPEQDRWFCQPTVEGDDWECVQDSAQAENPTNVRALPPPAPDPIEVPSLAPSIQWQGRLETAADPTPEPSTPPALEPDETLPRYAQLALRLTDDQRLINLPGEYYTAQIIAYRSPDDVTHFAEQRQLTDISSARIEKQGELFYAVLLGIYETRTAAEEAVANAPSSLAGMDIWIRRLRGLQQAIRRADALTATR